MRSSRQRTGCRLRRCPPAIHTDSSSIVIINAVNFNHEDLAALKGMLILSDGDDDDHSTHAIFENDERWPVEGELTKVEPSEGITMRSVTLEVPEKDAQAKCRFSDIRFELE